MICYLFVLEWCWIISIIFLYRCRWDFSIFSRFNIWNRYVLGCYYRSFYGICGWSEHEQNGESIDLTCFLETCLWHYLLYYFFGFRHLKVVRYSFFFCLQTFFMDLFTLVSVPFSSLTPRITSDSQERTNLTGFRMLGANRNQFNGALGISYYILGWR